MTCLVIAHNDDLHADAVVWNLKSRSEIIRIDPYEFLDLNYFSDEPNHAKINGREIEFTSISGVYCRLALESLSLSSDDPVSEYSFKEQLGAIVGISTLIRREKWVNFPWNEALCDNKVYPLIIAAQCGINVPKFLITNCWDSLNRSFNKNIKLVIKPITDSAIALQDTLFTSTPDYSDFRAPFTNELQSDIDFKNLVDRTPSLLQRKIQPIKELRATYIDGAVYTTISDRSDQMPDVRLSNRINEAPHALPTSLAEKFSILGSKLNLRFMTLDILLDLDGRHWLVDINPSGNWLWQEEFFDGSIALDIANALANGNHLAGVS